MEKKSGREGIVNPDDAEIAVKHGLDGLIVSNHGGRQLDRGQSTIVPMHRLVPEFSSKLKVMIDGSIAVLILPPVLHAVLISLLWAGRQCWAFAALGKYGGHHTFEMIKKQLQQVMEQVGCEKAKDLPRHLIQESVPS